MRAAKQGVVEAQSNLGVMYETGEGVPQDYGYAYMWWNLAAAQGHQNAKKNKEIITKKMNFSQIEQAQTLSRQCINSSYKDC